MDDNRAARHELERRLAHLRKAQEHNARALRIVQAQIRRHGLDPNGSSAQNATPPATPRSSLGRALAAVRARLAGPAR